MKSTKNNRRKAVVKRKHDINTPGDEGLYIRMRRCGHYLFHRSQRRDGQRRILFIIHGNGGTLAQRSLVDLLDIRSASLSEILEKLEVQGYIERQQNQQDRRNIDVSLTEDGRKAIADYLEEHYKKVHDLFEVLDEAEKEQLSSILGKLIHHWNVE